MGKRPLNRKQRVDRVNLEISLNSGDVSSKSKSGNAVVYREDRQLLAGLGIQANRRKALTIHRKQRQMARAQNLVGRKSQNNEQTAQLTQV